MTAPPKKTHTSQEFNLAPEAGCKAVLSLTSGQINPEGGGQPTTTISAGTVGSSQGAAVQFTISNTGSEYAEGYVTITYEVEGHGVTCECHLNFCLSATDSWWAQDTDAFPHDNTTILPAKSSGGTPIVLDVTQPTGGGGGGTDSLFQVLNPAMVFLVDYHEANKTYLFRGNTPFDAPKTNNGKQSVDFDALHTWMATRYEAETGDAGGFPAKGTYELRDVCLQDVASEGTSILWELESFGGAELSQLADDAWFPAQGSTTTPQMCNWPIQPHHQQSNDVFDLGRAEKLSAYMDAAGDTPVVYYIHCASGHDRTGIVASTYLAINRGVSLQRAMIQGTTVAKLTNGGGQLIVDCGDVGDTNKVDPDRSRVVMIADIYRTTVLNVFNSYQEKTKARPQADSVPTEVTQRDPALVYSSYPWSDAG